ncbi:hypothetical protein HanRHA438_Chr08g0349571 [Helianthus annuus]|nr:hypothetical protein HanRHA438_Chr08g0349571 [Helianthus annuus]
MHQTKVHNPPSHESESFYGLTFSIYDISNRTLSSLIHTKVTSFTSSSHLQILHESHHHERRWSKHGGVRWL